MASMVRSPNVRALCNNFVRAAAADPVMSESRAFDNGHTIPTCFDPGFCAPSVSRSAKACNKDDSSRT